MAAARSRVNHARKEKALAAKLLVTGDPVRTHEGKIHGSVVDAIGRWILGGTYAPDDLLPREDDLAEQLGVSRTSIREASRSFPRRASCKHGGASACGSAIGTIGTCSIRRFCPGIPTSDATKR
jgi:Bacterial regulatory proteins, gntR family